MAKCWNCDKKALPGKNQCATHLKEWEAAMAKQAKRQKEEEKQCKENFKVTIAELQQAKMQRVVIAYDGSGDSGAIESVTLYKNDKDEKGVELEYPTLHVGDGKETLDESPAQTQYHALSDWAYGQLEKRYGGWEINAGSSGEIIINLETGKINFNHSWNVEETEEDFEEESL